MNRLGMRVLTIKAAVLSAMLAGAGVASAAEVPAFDRTAFEESIWKALQGFYGVIDASVDETTKGMDGMVAYKINNNPDGTGTLSSTQKGANIYGGSGATPYGRVGWQPAISTNASTIGWRGDHAIPGMDTKFLIQVEAQIALTESPGVITSYTAQTNGIRGGLGTGTTFIGFGGKDWGAVKLGHSQTPYKKATDRLDPFAGMVGDMPVIMGNTGGDNRVEFNAAFDHAIWYESPKMGGFSFDFMVSPGQNRTADENLNLSGNSSNCSGGNIPGSGNLLSICDDGGYDNAYSLAFKFEAKEFYLTAAYELHKNVNRNSDGIGSNNPMYAMWMNEGDPTAGNGGPDSQYLNWGLYNAIGAAYGASASIGNGSCTIGTNANTYYCLNATPEFVGDIGDEAAYKIGAQYITDFGLTVDAILERLTRKIPAALQWQNERQRNGWWLAFTQVLSGTDNVNFGWAHAGKTPGDPGGQHNYDPTNTNDSADMLTLAWKHVLDKQLFLYLDLAETINHGNAHYDLGGGGHGIKTDCHDGTTQPIIDYTSAGNTTWGGCKPKAISIGVHYRF